MRGEKTVETRSYDFPKKYLNVEMALIETPGPKGRREGRIKKARIIGVICFSGSFRYKSYKAWKADRKRHLVSNCDPQFAYSAVREKWGWVVKYCKTFKKSLPPPKKRGIVFANSCQIRQQHL